MKPSVSKLRTVTLMQIAIEDWKKNMKTIVADYERMKSISERRGINEMIYHSRIN